MAVIHRALFVWFLVLIFSIMLVLHLDHRTEWSWFIVFVPMWMSDALALKYIGFNIVMHLKNGNDRTSMRLKVVYLTCFLLKLVFQLLLCLRLEYPEWHMNLAFVMLPLWMLLLIVLGHLTQRLWVFPS